MAAKETKVYPVEGRFMMGVPHVVHVVPTKADADDLIASGAFTTNPNASDRDSEALDQTDEGPIDHERTEALGEE